MKPLPPAAIMTRVQLTSPLIRVEYEYVNTYPRKVRAAGDGFERRACVEVARLLKGVVARRNGVRVGRHLIGPLMGLEPILAALLKPAVRRVDRNPAVEEI